MLNLGPALAGMVAQQVERMAAHQSTFTARGVVTGVEPLLVRFAGDTDPAGVPVFLKAAGYVPVVDDEVALQRFDADWVVAYAVERTT